MKFIFSIFLFALISININAQDFCTLVTTSNFSEGVLTTHHTYINSKGEILYKESTDPKIRERIFPLSSGFGRIRRGDKFGFINQKVEILIPTEYEKAEDFNEGLAPVRIEGKWGYINTKNEIVIKPVYKNILKFSNGLAVFGRDGKYGYINTKGEEVIKAQFDRVSHFTNNRAWVLLDGKWGCINSKGEMIIVPYYSDTQDFSEGYAWVKKDMIWGLIDSTNKYVIEPNEKNPLIYAHSGTYKNFGKFKSGLMISKANDQTGYCNKTFKKVIPSKFDHALDFENGYAIIEIDKRWGVIDTTGNLIIEAKYYGIKNLQYGFFAVKDTNGDWGIISSDSKIITKCLYTSIFEFDVIKN